MKKINLRQPKYIFPLVILVPLVALAYLVSDMVGGGGEQETASDGLITELPDADTDALLNKYDAMSRRFAKDDESYTAIGNLEDDSTGPETLDDAYTNEEKDAIDRLNEAREAQQEKLRELQDNLSRSRDRVRGGGMSQPEAAQGDDYTDQYAKMQEMALARQRMLQKMLYPEDEPQKGTEQPKPTPPAPPSLVLKSKETNAEKFNTISSDTDNSEKNLIKAMIDKTTKAHEGTRLRFKLLDDVTIEDVRLKKGTYLYGTVVGFGQQRVMAEITSIMVGNRFLNVSLAVFDNDGMEGFYVPESAFRDFMKNAGASAVSNNINFSSGGYGNEISGEAIALQALQNIYSAGTNAVAANMRKNRAKIKYNTIVYLINSKEAQ